MMFCAEEGVMEQERAYLEALAAVERLELSDDTLRLSGGGQVLVYTRGGEAASGEGSGEGSIGNETLQRWNALLDASAARGAAWTKDPLRIALTLLDAGDAPEVRLERRDESAEGAERTTVTLTEDGLADDSVRGSRSELVMTLQEDGSWRVESFERGYRCWRGENTENYTAESCP